MARRPSEAEILSQIPAARARATAERDAGLRATAARYDRKAGRLLLELTNGYAVGVPVTTLPALRNATSAQLTAVELSSTGSAIRIPAFDADMERSLLRGKYRLQPLRNFFERDG